MVLLGTPILDGNLLRNFEGPTDYYRIGTAPPEVANFLTFADRTRCVMFAKKSILVPWSEYDLAIAVQIACLFLTDGKHSWEGFIDDQLIRSGAFNDLPNLVDRFSPAFRALNADPIEWRVRAKKASTYAIKYSSQPKKFNSLRPLDPPKSR